MKLKFITLSHIRNFLKLIVFLKKMEIGFLGLGELSLEDFLYLELLEILKPRLAILVE